MKNNSWTVFRLRLKLIRVKLAYISALFNLLKYAAIFRICWYLRFSSPASPARAHDMRRHAQSFPVIFQLPSALLLTRPNVALFSKWRLILRNSLLKRKENTSSAGYVRFLDLFTIIKAGMVKSLGVHIFEDLVPYYFFSLDKLSIRERSSSLFCFGWPLPLHIRLMFALRLKPHGRISFISL